MTRFYKPLFFFFFLLNVHLAEAQLVITSESNGVALAQKLLGSGVFISNVSIKGDARATGFFNNTGGTNIGIDSGIVLTCGRAQTLSPSPGNWGLDGNGTTLAQSALATLQHVPVTVYSGDADLARQLGVDSTDTHDASVLEFDFIPLGDTIRFNYIFSSEEYTPAFVCMFNDAFAFFISGPGISGMQNIALVPGTSLPVSIFNVNDVPGGSCPNNRPYYVDNRFNKWFTHDGHTTVFTAIAQVQPCQQYHLKLVIADMTDGVLDSGVFLEAKSLSSNSITINNLTQTDTQGNSYLVEGCATGSFQIKRPNVTPLPLNVTLSYGGQAINGVDVQALPLSVTIPANDSMVTVNVVPVVDLIPEGIERLVIYALAGCSSGLPTDSAIIQIRDYDTLGITPPDTSFICRNSSITLLASGGYSIYKWDANPTLSNTNIPNPVAAPLNDPTTYYCVATEGTCNARDSVTLRWRKFYLNSTKGVNCRNGTTGEIKVSEGPGWIRPVAFSINNNPYQPDSVFTNLPVGVHRVKIKDASGCIDSMDVTLTQLFPDLVISNIATIPASCSGNPDGMVTITASGGNPPYLYSLDGVNFQVSNTFSIPGGNQLLSVRDNNNCITTQGFFIPVNNTVFVDAGFDTAICEGKSYQLEPLSNGTSFSWTPAATLSSSTIIDPIATPTVTTKYFITATTGICNRTDSVTVFVNAAPKPDAGSDLVTCFEKDIQLNGSGGISYTWTPATGLSNPNIFNPVVLSPSVSVTYYLAVTDAKGCSSLKNDSVLVVVTPPPVIKTADDTVLAKKQPLSLFVKDINNSGFTSYTWAPSYGLSNPFISNPVARTDRDITYYVTASTPIGCIAHDTLNIKVYEGPELYVPNAFTPNGDGLNDILKVIAIGMKNFHYLRVYNRYGQAVFSTNDPYSGWDGKLQGKIQNSGTYVWMAEAIDYRGNLIKNQGTTILIR